MNHLTNRQVFYKLLAQTSDSPVAVDISNAEGIYIWDTDGKKYIDIISGISVCNIGHSHPRVIAAVEEQLKSYMHVMVYGEYIQSPQTKLAEELNKKLPENLNNIYFVNSGSEAVEGALKLAKKHTARTEIISFNNAYHGSTHGALSVMGNEVLKNPFRPLLPDVRFIDYNIIEQLQIITNKTACVIIETVQGEAGAVVHSKEYMQALRKKCSEQGALLILDEIQTGFGRTGKWFAFEHSEIVPDILTIAKAFGAGMPLGAFISSSEIMQSLMQHPALGHITTFGGHPVSCAAALAGIKVTDEEKLIEKVVEKEKLFRKLLQHPNILNIRGKGLLLAIEFDSFETNKKVIDKCRKNGLLSDWFLFAPNCMRIAPPLVITVAQIEEACEIILMSL